jgi:hypothetical protein
VRFRTKMGSSIDRSRNLRSVELVGAGKGALPKEASTFRKYKKEIQRKKLRRKSRHLSNRQMTMSIIKMKLRKKNLHMNSLKWQLQINL